jgi:hypothetical protein
VARLAVKTYPENLKLGAKVNGASRIYGRLLRNLVTGN